MALEKGVLASITEFKSNVIEAVDSTGHYNHNRDTATLGTKTNGDEHEIDDVDMLLLGL